MTFFSMKFLFSFLFTAAVSSASVTSTYVFPTGLGVPGRYGPWAGGYETVVCTLLFIILWALRRRIKVPGVMFGIYLILNGIEL